jgi:hypothetical protein
MKVYKSEKEFENKSTKLNEIPETPMQKTLAMYLLYNKHLPLVPSVEEK